MKHKRRKEDLENNPHFKRLYQRRLRVQKEEKQKKESDLFDNAMVRAAKSKMTQEQLDRYKKIGEDMYSGIDFVGEDGKRKETVPQEFVESAKQIIESVLSGQHPCFLEENEKNLMKELYGENWYLKYGYEAADLDEVVNFPKLREYMQEEIVESKETRHEATSDRT